MDALRRLRERWLRWMPFGAMYLPWVGGLLVVVAGSLALHSWLAIRADLRAEATATENIAAQDSNGQVVYATHLRFRLPDGAIVTFVDPVRSSQNDEPDFPVGTVVPVAYPRSNPGGAAIATTGRLYFAAIVLGVLGIVFIDSAILLRLALKRRRSPDDRPTPATG